MPHETSTENLIARSTGGDRSAKLALLEENLPALLAFVRLNAGELIRTHESSADIVSSICREILDEDLDAFEYRSDAQFRSWLFKRAVNKLNNRRRYYLADCRDVRRNEACSRPESFSGLAALYASIGSPTQHAIAVETIERFESCCAKLSEDDRQIITMSKVTGMSNAEIAEELALNENTTRVRLHRALARLGTLMHFGEDDRSG